jgi:hypothetical protein
MFLCLIGAELSNIEWVKRNWKWNKINLFFSNFLNIYLSEFILGLGVRKFILGLGVRKFILFSFFLLRLGVRQAILLIMAVDFKVSCSKIPRHAFARIRTLDPLVESPTS